MHSKKKKEKNRKAKLASNKVLLASVTEEMAKPRMAKSASIKSEKQIDARDRTAE
jgi:hypothetical protein